MSSGTMGLDKIPDSVGFMILNEDGKILSAGGDMEGQERIAGKRLMIDDGAIDLYTNSFHNAYLDLTINYFRRALSITHCH